MTTVGITGHQNITPATRKMIAAAIAGELARLDGDRLTGVSCLAAGADQVFAFCVLAAGGRLRVIQASDGYRDTLHGTDQTWYDHLRTLASDVSVLPFPAPSEAAYHAAGQAVVEQCGLLLAVWDGGPSGGLGGTADIVGLARDKQRAVRVVWPDGAARG